MAEGCNTNGGLCHCGCGEPAPLALANDSTQGYVKGQPKKYVLYHESRTRKGKTTWDGYTFVYKPDHPNAKKNGYVAEHRLAMENIYGTLTSEYDVHHLNGDKSDNRPHNLEVMHRSLHGRLSCTKPITSPEGYTWKVCW